MNMYMKVTNLTIVAFNLGESDLQVHRQKSPKFDPTLIPD